MDFEKFKKTMVTENPGADLSGRELSGTVELSRTAEITVDKETYLEAESRGMTLSELLETPEYDPSPDGSPLDAFERQLALDR